MRPAYAVFMAWTLFYAFKKRLTGVFWRYARFAKFPGIDAVLLMLGIVCGTIGETVLKCEIFEECFETLFYVSFADIVCLYANNKNFKVSDK